VEQLETELLVVVLQVEPQVLPTVVVVARNWLVVALDQAVGAALLPSEARQEFSI
jgi:hypothetical protein